MGKLLSFPGHQGTAAQGAPAQGAPLAHGQAPLREPGNGWLTIRSVVKSFKKRMVVRGVSLDLARGEVPGLAPAEVLMVGDTLETDVLGAQRLGFRTALALSGNTPPRRLAAEVERTSVQPDHVVRAVSPDA